MCPELPAGFSFFRIRIYPLNKLNLSQFVHLISVEK
jgi:hypothetical protein